MRTSRERQTASGHEKSEQRIRGHRTEPLAAGGPVRHSGRGARAGRAGRPPRVLIRPGPNSPACVSQPVRAKDEMELDELSSLTFPGTANQIRPSFLFLFGCFNLVEITQ